MNELTIIKRHGGHYIDSREVAELIGKDHRHLLRDIRGYIKIIEDFNAPNFGRVDFFIDSTYSDAKGEARPCYLLSKMGCELVANKLTGEKGVLFTAAYVAKFNELESGMNVKRTAITRARLGEYNACARLVVCALKNAAASSELVLRFLAGVYEPLGITVNADEVTLAPRWYSAQEIAVECGLYSLSGNPHSQAAACLLNENLIIGKEHKRVETASYGDHLGVSIRYDAHALAEVIQWLIENNCPPEIYGFERTYHVRYKQ